MYFIIESQDQLDRLGVSDECFVQVITNNDNYHPKLSNAILVYYRNNDKGYILCSKHSESYSIPFSTIKNFIESHSKVYLLDKKFHSYFFNTDSCVDVRFTLMDQLNGNPDLNCDTLTKKDFYAKRGINRNINEVIPIVKHYESAECLYDQVKPYFGVESNLEHYNDLSKAYKYVEEQGLAVSVDFEEKFGVDNQQLFKKESVVYSSYNLYNLTSRPTNAYNGVNFLAIPKKGEYREKLVPKNDFFVEFDFDSYHLRLIAKIIGFEVQRESLHTHLGKHYFQKDELTDEEYSESKKITFRQLYGGIESQYENIEFFSNLKQYIEKQYARYTVGMAYELPSGRVIKYSRDINKLKLFNYIVQNYETLENVKRILQLKDMLSGKKTQVVLITYDAFLIDFDVNDGKETLSDIKIILQSDSMIVNHKYGKSYNF